MIATLMYHSIDQSGSPISASPATFARHLKWLTSGRVRVLPLDGIVRESGDAPDAVAVTFDDGFVNAKPVLDELLANGIIPTVFVVPGHVGRTNAWGGRDQAGIPTLPLLDWDALGELATRGARIEAHSRTHPHCTELTRDQLVDELEGGRDDIERRLGRRSSHFAYPYGDLNDAVVERARATFAFAHTTEMRSLSGRDDAARRPRLDMYYFQAEGALDGFGTPAFRRRLTWLRTRRAIRARVFG